MDLLVVGQVAMTGVHVQRCHLTHWQGAQRLAYWGLLEPLISLHVKAK